MACRSLTTLSVPRSDRYPQRLMPPASTRAAWRDAARTLGLKATAVRTHDQRLLALWKSTLDLAREMPEWDERHLWLIADYVEARRLALEHQLQADREGRYAEHLISGRQFAHPAIDKAREARRESREIAAELLLTPKALRDAGLEEDPDDGTPKGDQAGL